ncbi:MAG: helix-turn-helix transcriptional regulator [Candidatus Freyarchaeota archaeon]|nr:helix-turn-helix transcriptional regulator [Candidatus Jordarchaeia archaeon]
MRVIDYRSLLERRHRRSILEGLSRAGGVIRFSELCRSIKMPKSSLEYNLTVLEGRGIIKREGGLIKLQYTTPLGYIFDSPSAYAYLGLLGERGERTESETETAINLLREEGIFFEKIVIVTTHRAVADWENLNHLNVEWCLLSDEGISRVETVEKSVESRLVELIRIYKVIMDCTSATKPATIAYYRLATRFKVPLVYIYEKKRERIWVISKKDLERELLGNP